MKILFDQGVPAPLGLRLGGHVVDTAYALGWSRLKNGELIAAAEANGYDVLLTTDQNLRYQQNLSGRRIGILVLLSTSWPRIQRNLGSIEAALSRVRENSYEEVPIP